MHNKQPVAAAWNNSRFQRRTTPPAMAHHRRAAAACKGLQHVCICHDTNKTWRQPHVTKKVEQCQLHVASDLILAQHISLPTTHKM
jgi:hypothetical protein